MSDPLLANGEEAALALARVAGWSTATFNCSLTPSQRGVYPNREVSLGTGFPFGLYQASRLAEVPRRLVVWPQTFWLPPLGVTGSRPHWRGAVNESRAGSDGTRLGVRDHRVGDSLRDVHWAKSARYDRLIVSERESTTVEDASVVVPVGPPTHAVAPGDASDATLEWRLRIAASICESFVSNHGEVDLWLGGKRFSAGRSPGDFERLLDGVAEFRADTTPEATPRGETRASGVAFTVDADGSTIVLRRSGSQGVARCVSSNRPAWIRVESLTDVPERVLRGWRRGSGARRAKPGVSRVG